MALNYKHQASQGDYKAIPYLKTNRSKIRDAVSWAWWRAPVITAFTRQRREEWLSREFKTSLGCCGFLTDFT